ncbi:MAG: hypothetical protein BGO68_00100 [Candidatus Amoebophilus sp. 36-38]|nr:MAG: hypothetical protein BGO68_00100 [Candidatus Amoebophilus sp. 36-38]
MSKSKSNLLSCFILTLFVANCNFNRSTQNSPKISNETQVDDDKNSTKKNALISAVDIDMEQKDGPQKKQKSNIKKTSKNKLLINPQLLNKFFKELEDIQPDYVVGGKISRIKNKALCKTWVADWDKTVKSLKKGSPQIEQKSLQIVGCMMKLSDKNPKNTKKNSANEVIKQFTEDIKKISKKKKTSSLKKVIVASIKEVKEPLLKAQENCKREKEKIRLKNIQVALDAFERMINT